MCQTQLACSIACCAAVAAAPAAAAVAAAAVAAAGQQAVSFCALTSHFSAALVSIAMPSPRLSLSVQHADGAVLLCRGLEPRDCFCCSTSTAKPTARIVHRHRVSTFGRQLQVSFYQRLTLVDKSPVSVRLTE